MGRKTISTSGFKVESAISILRPRDEVYRFCQDVQNWRLFLTAIDSVEPLTEGKTLWKGRWGADKTVQWENEVFEDEADNTISWSSIAGSEVVTSGSFRFRPAPAGRGTEVHLAYRFDLPSDTLRDWMAKILGEDPLRQIHNDLRRLKQLMETGELATTAGQTRGKG